MAVQLAATTIWETMAPHTYATDDGYTSKTKENIEDFAEVARMRPLPFPNIGAEHAANFQVYKKEAAMMIRRYSQYYPEMAAETDEIEGL